MDCLFCSMQKGEIPFNAVYEDDFCFVIKDIAPVAPVHLLIIPKEHLKNASELVSKQELSEKIFYVADTVAKQQGLENGYRLITNVGKEAGQSVMHLHFHLLGGKALSWPEL